MQKAVTSHDTLLIFAVFGHLSRYAFVPLYIFLSLCFSPDLSGFPLLILQGISGGKTNSILLLLIPPVSFFLFQHLSMKWAVRYRQPMQNVFANHYTLSRCSYLLVIVIVLSSLEHDVDSTSIPVSSARWSIM